MWALLGHGPQEVPPVPGARPEGALAADLQRQCGGSDATRGEHSEHGGSSRC